MPPSSHQARRETTRTDLLKAARSLFASRSFTDVPADEIVAVAGVTRGALHYHFGDKRGLFEAVFEELETEIATDLARLVESGDGSLLRRALAAFLDICERPEVCRIALTDAPAVLGWRRWREIESHHGLGLLSALLGASREDKQGSASTSLLAQLILGSVIEAALFVANADNKEKARTQVESLLAEMFADLLD